MQVGREGGRGAWCGGKKGAARELGTGEAYLPVQGGGATTRSERKGGTQQTERPLERQCRLPP